MLNSNIVDFDLYFAKHYCCSIFAKGKDIVILVISPSPFNLSSIIWDTAFSEGFEVMKYGI